MKQRRLSGVGLKIGIMSVVSLILLLVMLVAMLLSVGKLIGMGNEQLLETGQRRLVHETRVAWLDTMIDATMIGSSSTDKSIESAAQNLDLVAAGMEKLKAEKLPAKIVNPGDGQTYNIADLFTRLEASYTDFRTRFDAFKSQYPSAGESEKVNLIKDFAGFVAQRSGEADGTFLNTARAMLDGYTVAAKAGSQATADANRTTIIVGIVILVVTGVIVLSLPLPLGRPVERGIRALQWNIRHYGRNDFTDTFGPRSNDEIGDMSRNIETVLVQVSKSMGETRDNLQSTLDAMDEVLEHAKTGSEQIDKSLDFINNGAAAAEQVSSNISTVAAGAEEMGASIREISSNANEAAKIAAEATEVAQRTNETVAKLGVSSQEIGEVIETITAVAEQTNLLALNATIEAARAGEAGKGFAVVASEVKDLAAETSAATQDVAARIEQIQKDTDSAVAAIEEISGIIASINDYQTTIAAAVEEQTATTAEMARSVQEASDSSVTIAENVADIARNTQGLADIYSQGNQVVSGMREETTQILEFFADLKLRQVTASEGGANNE